MGIAFITATEMGIFDIAPEIRLKIYSELLVLSEPIVFEVEHGHTLQPLFRSNRDGLCPALLGVNKRIYSEASTLFYSKNRFQFPIVYNSAIDEITHIAPFLHQIGSQASHIRHICIPFPSLDYPTPHKARICEEQVRNLDLVRDTCTSIRVLELLTLPACVEAEALDLLNTQFKSFPSLKEIVINFELFHDEDQADDLTKTIHDYGWSVKVTRIPRGQWYSSDDRVVFDNEEDYWEYEHELDLIEERKERHEWVEKYHRRRSDPYWKNDSDYD